MNQIIDKIEMTVSLLLKSELDAFDEQLSELVNMMMRDFPVIISYYYNPLMSEYASDASYWPAQLERILNVINSGDFFAISDVLFNETRPNLIELQSVLKEKGILS